jgi:pimeloyl-ACP methyl ester carboxylesterase
VPVEVAGGTLELLDLPGAAPALVLLHEGLGSVELWRGFGDDLHRLTGLRTVAFSRFGHGRSDPPPRPRTPGFMHEEARAVLPQVLAALGIRAPILVGHSDGASIALIFAAEHDATALVLLAPHVFVEDMSLSAIAGVRDTFETHLRDRMAKYHDDPEVTFRGWCDVWLDPEFRCWDLEPLLPSVTAPTLLIQGRDDEYATLAHVESIAAHVAGPAEVLVVDGGHSPHLEQREQVLAAVAAFVGSTRGSDQGNSE